MSYRQAATKAALVALGGQPCGDVVAARTCARSILRPDDMPDPCGRDALLLLTAACLHLHAQTQGELEPGALMALLDSARLAQVFANSHSAFLRFVASEIDDFGALVFAPALARVRAVLLDPAPAEGASPHRKALL